MEAKEQIQNFKNNVLPELTREELEERCLYLYSKNLELTFMIENGLGFEDMINDIQPMHEI
jgi:hypothetical protein